MTKIHTAKGKIPLWMFFVDTEKVVHELSGEVDWITTYRFLGFFVWRQDIRKAGPLLKTTKGELPSRLLDLSLRHKEMPCGTSIATEFFYLGEMVKRNIAQEVYTIDSTKGDS